MDYQIKTMDLPKPEGMGSEAKVIQTKDITKIAYQYDQDHWVITTFEDCHASMFDDPTYGSYIKASMLKTLEKPVEVLPSPWTAALSHMNVMNSYHPSGNFHDYHHYAIPFKDVTFECLALSVSIERVKLHGEQVFRKMSIDIERGHERTITYNKLVRDKIPEIIKKSGSGYRIKHLRGDAFRDALANKLVEEAKEFQEEQSMEELGDVLEVLEAIIANASYTLDDVEKCKDAKCQQRGGFELGIHLIDVTEKVKK